MVITADMVTMADMVTVGVMAADTEGMVADAVTAN